MRTPDSYPLIPDSEPGIAQQLHDISTLQNNHLAEILEWVQTPAASEASFPLATENSLETAKAIGALTYDLVTDPKSRGMASGILATTLADLNSQRRSIFNAWDDLRQDSEDEIAIKYASEPLPDEDENSIVSIRNCYTTTIDKHLALRLGPAVVASTTLHMYKQDLCSDVMVLMRTHGHSPHFPALLKQFERALEPRLLDKIKLPKGKSEKLALKVAAGLAVGGVSHVLRKQRKK